MFNKLRYKLAVFMAPRYGIDALYKALLLFYFVLAVLYAIFDKKIFSILMTVVFVYMVFRVFSKNHIARAKENRLFLKFSAPFSRFFGINFKRLKDIRKKRYRVCPFCKATVRLPIKKGKHSVNCPKCKKTFKVKILF